MFWSQNDGGWSAQGRVETMSAVERSRAQIGLFKTMGVDERLGRYGID